MSISNCRDFIAKLKRTPDGFFIIHYSCQSLFDDNAGLSPRITSIAVVHFATEQTVSFSTHAIAEELHITRENVPTRFDEVERRLLDNFYRFMQERRGAYWVHWNMRNLTYGFEHLEHRYRVLGGTNPSVVPVEQRINLNDMLADHYGNDYAANPKMPSLMQLNGGISRHFLTGEQEVEAFRNQEYLRMHNSTLCKVGFFHFVVRQLIQGRLKTSSKGFGVKLDRLFESRLAKVIALLSSIAGVIALVVFAVQIFSALRAP